MITFDDIARRHGTDKASRIDVGVFAGAGGHDYMSIYERILGSRRGDPLRILEIGVQHGYSLRTWEECFPYAEVVGLDNNPMCKPGDFSRARLVIGDAEQWEVRNSVGVEGGRGFDLIVEDAGHQSAQQIKLLWMYLPLVRPGGFYVMEDLGCGLLPFFGGNPEGDTPSVLAELGNVIVRMHQPQAPPIRSFRLWRDILFLEKA